MESRAPWLIRAPGLEASEDFDTYQCISLRLPFRLRVGKARTFILKDGLVRCENECDIPLGSYSIPDHTHELALRETERPESLTTETTAVISFIPDERAIKELKSTKSGTYLPRIAITAREARTCLNDFLVAYTFTTGAARSISLIGPLPYSKFLSALTYYVLYLVPSGYQISENDISFIKEEAAKAYELGKVSQVYPLDDIPEERLKFIPDVYRLCKKYLFYELYSEAVTASDAGEPRLALLFAVMALEAAVNVLYERGIKDLVQRAGDAGKYVESKFARRMLAEKLGAVPDLYLQPTERPSKAEMDAAQKAVTIRNDIMHSLKGETGYKVKERTENELRDGYYAANTVFNKLRFAIESRIASEWTQLDL